MDQAERNRIRKTARYNQLEYLNEYCNATQRDLLDKKFLNFNNKFKTFLRSEYASRNSLKQIPHLSSLIWGIQDYQRQLRLVPYGFTTELSIVNKYLITTLDRLSTSKYNSQCASYGEALLNCYLDLYITFTIRATPKEIDAHPNFLVNPLTGSLLELDVFFEDFKLAFEFQGEHHYTNPNVQVKDTTKQLLSSANNHVLIPVNISQLSHNCLASLICNSIKEQHDLTAFFNHFNNENVNKRSAHQLYKVIQRICLSHLLYKEAIDWLDAKSQTYINGRIPSSPISAQTNAPRINHKYDSEDLDISTLYLRIPKLRKLESL